MYKVSCELLVQPKTQLSSSGILEVVVQVPQPIIDLDDDSHCEVILLGRW